MGNQSSKQPSADCWCIHETELSNSMKEVIEAVMKAQPHIQTVTCSETFGWSSFSLISGTCLPLDLTQRVRRLMMWWSVQHWTIKLSHLSPRWNQLAHHILFCSRPLQSVPGSGCLGDPLMYLPPGHMSLSGILRCHWVDPWVARLQVEERTSQICTLHISGPFFIHVRLKWPKMVHSLLRIPSSVYAALDWLVLTWNSCHSYLIGRTGTKGVPQGSVLGSDLFTWFSNNLVSLTNSGSIHYYAVDTVVYSFTPSTDKALNYHSSIFIKHLPSLERLQPIRGLLST